MAQPFVKMPGTGRPDRVARQPGKIPIPRNARNGAEAVVSGISFVLARIDAGLLVVSLIVSSVPLLSGQITGIPFVALVTLADLIHLLAMWGRFSHAQRRRRGLACHLALLDRLRRLAGGGIAIALLG